MSLQPHMIETLRGMILDSFDERMEQEKEDRDSCEHRDDFNHHQGRVDGVDTGRRLVEEALEKFNV